MICPLMSSVNVRECTKGDCALWCKEIKIPLSSIGTDPDILKLVVGIVSQLSPMGVKIEENSIKIEAHCTLRGKQ